MKFKRYSTAEDTYTTLPATFQTSGADAENYQVYGKTVENLADAIIEHANITSDGRIFNPGAIDPAGDTFVLYIAPVVSGKAYTITTSTYDSAVVYAFYSTQPAYDVVSYNNARTVLEGTHQATITAPITGWIAFRDYVTAPAGMIVEGSTPAPIYVPPGASGGVGVQTENLFDSTKRQSYEGFWNNTGGYVSSPGWYGTLLIDVEPSTEYSFNPNSTAGASAKHLFYDENGGMIGYISSGRQTFTTPDNCVMMRFSYRSSSSNIMLVKGSTAPTTYIPYGYKIPILNTSGVTENLWDLNSSWTNSLTDTKAIFTPQLVQYNGNTRLSTAGISVDDNGHYSIRSYLADTDYTRIYLKHNGSTRDLVIGNIYSDFKKDKRYIISFDVSGYDPTIVGGIKLENIMLTEGSTAPDHYIPHRYTSNYDLFVGGTKLYEDEYLDYEKQKVYKRTENDFPFAKKGTFAFGNDGYIISNGEGKFFAAIPTSVSSTINSVLIPLNETYTIPQSLDTGGEFIFYLGNNVTKAGLLLVLYDANGVQIENWAFTSKWRISTAYNQMAGKTIAYIGLRAVSNSEQGNIELTPMFSKNDNLTSYIPYLQPTDPPVPFPAIQAYIGENNLSVDTTVQPEQVVLEYAGWREIDAKKYVNGEWVTITPKQYTGGSWS